MTDAAANLAVARAYLKALADGRPEDAQALFDPQIVQVEHPNRLKPNGETRHATKLAADGQQGLQLLARQTYEIVGAVAEGDRVALEVVWTGVLAVPLRDLKPGDEMRCFSGIFLDFRDGKIIGQRNHDCFPPF